MHSLRLEIYFSSMRRKRFWLAAWVILLLAGRPLGPQVVDCLVAEVNGRAMTLTDIRILKELAIRPLPEVALPPETLRQTLEEAIDRKVVIELAREDIEVIPEEVDDLLARWKGRFEAEDWSKRLAAFGLQEKGLRPYAEEMIRYVKTINLHFGRTVDVDSRDVERYYEAVYAPSERTLGREPKPLALVQAEIEARIKSQRVSQQSANWVKSLRAQAEVRIYDQCLEEAK